MLKRHPKGSLKRHRSTAELLPLHVVEQILERLDVKPLGRFKSVSKTWKSTIESRTFKQGQFIRRTQSRGPDVLYVSRLDIKDDARTVFGSSILSVVKFPTSNTMVSHGSCDGLVCLFCIDSPSIVVNPATRWHQIIPLSNVQQLLSHMYNNGSISSPRHQMGLGKDKIMGTYKPVWLSNSSEFGLDNATTCEVFDFSTNAWRYVLPSSPCRILDRHKPVYLDGSLYWLTEGEETKVLSFDLHTETFQVICKAPFPHAPDPNYVNVTLCVLDDRLCVSQKDFPTQTQVIWSLHSSGTWKELCSIDLTKTFRMFDDFPFAPSPIPLPIAILEKSKLLLGFDLFQPLVIHDLHTKSYEKVLQPLTGGYPVCYFQSLFTASSN